MGNKGMAISGILYSILILFMALIFGVLSILSSSKMSFNKYKDDLISNLTGDIDKSAGFKMYSEDVLNGTDPILDQNMIPVTIANNGEVRTADLTEKWYSYEDKMWANAVIVKEEKLNQYLNADYKTKIVLDDILAYFVWIPRYKYKISTSGTTTPTPIDIVFENSSTTKSVGNAKTEYYSHPGFTFGEEELNGIWVGKFETTGTGEKPTILPNEIPFAGINISTMFATSKRYDAYLETGNAHMMKNTEWTTASYLSHSKYGRNTQIRINNNESYITGCGASADNKAKVDECEISYDSGLEILPQSTSDNISGIFDMAGGSWERLMANYNHFIGESGFNTLPEEKYFNVYTNTDFTKACNGGLCLGHGLTETRGWYGDYFLLFSNSLSWADRGGGNTSLIGAGLFYFGSSSGRAYPNGVFRIVIV